MERPLVLRAALAAVTVVALSLSSSGNASADGAATATKGKIHRAPKSSTGPLPWCNDGETETLPNGLCYINGGQKEGRRTLVVFLHGAIAKDVDWQWLQARALTRQAKQSKFDAVFARAPLGPGGYVWPGSAGAQQSSESELIEGWTEARAFLERRSDRRYDEVFLMGFSSGAYFVSSLALRSRVKFDGYAVFAGGAGWGAPSSSSDASSSDAIRAPVYVGVCADDRQTANHSRAFGGVLAAKGWPHRVDEQRVGHMFSDVHVAHALTYLRSSAR
jgi:predicted esterase